MKLWPLRGNIKERGGFVLTMYGANLTTSTIDVLQNNKQSLAMSIILRIRYITAVYRYKVANLF